MATRKKASQKETGGDVLQTAAKAIGSAIGNIASKVGIGQDEPRPPKKKIGKLPKSGKKRLPRKEKKRLQKAAAKQGKVAD